MSVKSIGYEPSSPLLYGDIIKLIVGPEVKDANAGRPAVNDMIVLELSSRSLIA